MRIGSLKVRALSGSALCVLLGAAAQANAQQAEPTSEVGASQLDPAGDDPATQPDDIVVTGIRESLRASIERKRAAANITETITATDIGKLPDENVADSLQRVTGIQISRESGEGRSATIRGLAATTYINGRAAASPGDTRDFDLRNLTADFFESVEVSKSVLASQPEGTLGGSINLVTRKPLSFDELTISAGTEATYSDYAKEVDPRGNFFIADKITDTLGVAIGLSYTRRSIRQDVAFSQSGLQIGQAPTDTGFDFNRDGVLRDYIRPNDYRFMSQRAERERLGGDVTLQWRPTPELTVRLDAIGARLVNEVRESFLSAVNGFAPANASNILLDDNGFLQSGTFRNSAVNVDGRYRPEVYESSTLGLNAAWTPGRLSVLLDLSRSTGDFKEFSQILRLGGPLATVNYSANGNSRPANVDVRTAAGGAYDFFTPAIFTPNLTFDRVTKRGQKNDVGTLDLIYEFEGDFLQNIKAGVRLTKFQFEASVANIGNEFNDVRNPAFFSPTGQRLNASQPPLSGLITSDFPSQGGFFRGVAGNFPREWLTTIYRQADPDTGSPIFIGTLNFAGKRAIAPLSVADVREETQGGYLTADIDTNFFGLRLRANLGARVVRTDLVSRGLDTQSRPVRVANSYTDVLPAGNLRLDLTDSLLFRFAAAKILQRADLLDLQTSFNVVPGAGSATIGNPELKPYEATQFDAALEYYFGRDGLLSATFFYKDVTNFLISSTTLAEIPGYVPLNRPPGDPLGDQFFITQRVNGSGAKIKGVELSYQQPFTFLPDALQGFGTVLNYTYSDAKTSTGAPYEGLAKHTVNVIGYFERGPINARVAYNYRSRTAQTIGANFNANILGTTLAADRQPIGLYQFLIPQGYLDASLSYQVSDAVRVVIEGVNLTREQQILYVGNRSTLNEVYKTDRRISAGVRVTF